MKRMVMILAAICVAMVLLAGSGAFLLSKIFIAQSKVDAVTAVSKGVSQTLSEQIILLNSVLDKMVQDPDVINAAVQNNPELLTQSLKKVETHFPGALSIKFLLLESKDPSKPPTVPMGFADLDMARKTFDKDQPSAIQGDNDADRHLAIARRVTQNGAPVAVVLVGLNYDFVKRVLSTVNLEKGYLELRQDKLVLASSGEKSSKNELDDDPMNVPNTAWQLYSENSSGTTVIEFSLMLGMVLIPALAVALGFVTGYRKLSDMLTEDSNCVIKAFKDIVTDKPLGEYPIKLSEMGIIVSTIAQFKRVVSDGKRFDI